MSNSNLVEIEVNGANNRNLFFAPLGRGVRGRFELLRATAHDKDAGLLTDRWSEPIPGQHIGIDLDTGEGFITEPLHEERYAATRDRVKKKHRLDPPRQSFKGVHVPTWLYWLKRVVDAELGRLVDGQFPPGVGVKRKQDALGDEPKLDLFLTHHADPIDKLTAAIEKQTEMFGKLLNALLDERKRPK